MPLEDNSYAPLATVVSVPRDMRLEAVTLAASVAPVSVPAAVEPEAPVAPVAPVAP